MIGSAETFADKTIEATRAINWLIEFGWMNLSMWPLNQLSQNLEPYD